LDDERQGVPQVETYYIAASNEEEALLNIKHQCGIYHHSMYVFHMQRLPIKACHWKKCTIPNIIHGKMNENCGRLKCPELVNQPHPY
jgi:hypothetical protein